MGYNRIVSHSNLAQQQMFVSMRCHQNLVKNFVRWKFKVFSHAAFLSLPFKPGFPIYEEGKSLNSCDTCFIW